MAYNEHPTDANEDDVESVENTVDEFEIQDEEDDFYCY